MVDRYSYDRNAAKSKTTEKEKKPSKGDSKTDGAKPDEVTRALKTIEIAIDAIHDCAPSARDYQEEGDYDSKAYSKAVADHGKRIDALHDIASDLSKLLGVAKTAASTNMRAGMWYTQEFRGGETVWFLAEREQKNEGFAGKKVEWYTRRTPKVIKTSVPKSFWLLWKEVPKSEVPPEVLEAV